MKLRELIKVVDSELSDVTIWSNGYLIDTHVLNMPVNPKYLDCDIKNVDAADAGIISVQIEPRRY